MQIFDFGCFDDTCVVYSVFDYFIPENYICSRKRKKKKPQQINVIISPRDAFVI